ncbi:MAG: sigma-70 family RNA polymerase sigma factor [Caldilineales bacterium]|nr:sigma-70 family RNA polymerase sigma factor [Caldilineales bacterium]
MNDLENRCLASVVRLTVSENWPLSAVDQTELARATWRYLSAGATDAEIETVVRNYYQDGPLYEIMSQRRYREGDDYWESYRRGFVKLAVKRGVDFTQCEDVANEAIAQALKAFSQYTFRGSLNAWLYRIAANVCNDWHSDRKRRAIVIPPSTAENTEEEDVTQSLPAPLSEQPDETILQDERHLILETTFSRLLTNRDLSILHYSFIETEYLDEQTRQPRPWNDADIARLVGLAPASIPKIRQRIVQRLAKNPELKEMMIQLLGPEWFTGRAHPVRKGRRQESDQYG